MLGCDTVAECRGRILGKPEGPFNPLRTWLTIHTYAKPYDGVFNPLVYKAGCP